MNILKWCLVGRYMADARDQVLPLIGGTHDWAYLFSLWGMMDQAEIIGQGVKILGMIVMGVAICWLIIQLVIVHFPRWFPSYAETPPTSGHW